MAAAAAHYYFVPYTEPDDSLAKFAGTKSPNTPESSPYKAIKYFADNNQTIVNKVEGSETNDFSISNNSSIKVKNDEGTKKTKSLSISSTLTAIYSTTQPICKSA